MFEIYRFLRNVSIPDQHVLAEPEIRPEDRESKHELTQIMQVFLVYQFKVSEVFQIYHEDGDQCNTRYKGRSKCVPAVHGAIPVCINTHKPQPGNGRSNG